MSALPRITEEKIRKRATAQSWERGVEYFYAAHVANVIWREDTLTAEVEGSQYEPYLVRVTFAPNSDILAAHCTCPYDWGGDCKHIVATLLHLLHHPHEIEVRPPLSSLLRGLSHERLVELLLQLAGIHPQIVETAEELLLASTSPADNVPSPSSVDLAFLQRQIKAELRAVARTSYDEYLDEGYVEFGAALEPALESAEACLEADNARQAIAVLEAATMAWVEGWRSLDEELADYIEEDEYLNDFGRVWARAVLQADLSPQERAHWSKTLGRWAGSMPGGEALEIAVTAAEQGWDYPPLVAAMQGHITEKGAWEGEAPAFADDLAVIRLDILERRGQFEEYLNLAQAEGQHLLYVQMLRRLGRTDMAIKEAYELLTIPQEVHVFARELIEHNEVERGLELAEYGLSLEYPVGRAELAEWLRDEAQSRGRTELAGRAAWKALEAKVTLDNYKWLAEHTGAHWPDLRPQALRIVEASRDVGEIVDVYLYERMYRQAMDLVDRTSWFSPLGKVIEAVQGEYPDWAFRKCCQQAEAIMDAGKADRYETAIEWLRKGQDILLAAGRTAEWHAYLDHLLDKHQRKYKLVPMLKRLA
ncbi:MAG: SWIM zinc finger family protein [Anaerolineae bacterium]|nr:SWIM zinc finger family protein [Anaerolineae bacterium]